MSFILNTYGDTSIKTDVVLNAIEYLTAAENYVFNRLSNTSAISTVHSYQTDTYKSLASLAVAETADYSNTALTTPSLLTNIVELIAYKFEVSNTQRRVSHYQGEDELSRQVKKGLVEWTRAAEFDLIRSTLTSGVSGTAVKMSKLATLLRTCYNKLLNIKQFVWNVGSAVTKLRNVAISFVMLVVMLNGRRQLI